MRKVNKNIKRVYMDERQMFEQSFRRPRDFFKLTTEEQWKIDARLGILDWEGKDLSEDDRKRFCRYFGIDCTNDKS